MQDLVKFKTVYIAEDPLDLNKWTTEECIDVRDFMMTRFPTWPETARIYHKNVSKANDVTPANMDDIKRLGELEGPFYVVVYPAVTAVIYAVVSFALSYIASLLFSPSPPSAGKNRQTSSSNNRLTDRTNQARTNLRIPDIFGTVRSIPDLISLPYKKYINNKQVEISYMCIGRGTYEVEDVRENTTLISAIASSSVEIWAPYTSPNSGDSPQLLIGDDITEPLFKATQVSSVNGQTLRAPNANSIKGDTASPDIKLVYPDLIQIDSGSNIDFEDYFAAGDSLTITNGSTNGYNFNGTYTILSVDSLEITLSSPSSVNANWGANLMGLPGSQTSFFAPTLATTGDKWVGPFIANVTDAEQFLANFVSLNGLYKDNGARQLKMEVEVELELTPVDANGDPTGSAETFTGTLEGSATLKDMVAVSVNANPTFTGRCSARARRITDTDLTYRGTVVDEIKWEGFYAMTPVDEEDFGDVTTVYAQTFATAGALSIKERQLNMKVTRKLPLRISGSTFDTDLTETNSADEIIAFICKDPTLGGLSNAEIDFDSIYDTVQEVKDYFGNDTAGTFNYTFDDDNMSFEEMVSTVAQVIFCTAYRQGNQIKLSFEKATEDSTLIFNHRNKLPNSETRTISFGTTNDNDGVQLDYVNPDDDEQTTYYIPTDRSAVNPIKLETAGIRSHEQAFWHAWRAWNKIQYQNIATQFIATTEAAITTINERILVADNTRQQSQDGEVIGQTGLTLTLSQDVELEDGVDYTIFLQLYDGTTESIEITAGDEANEVVLAVAPSLDLVIEDNMYARTTYMIVGNNQALPTAFLVSEKDAQDSYKYQITAKNYSPLYYQQDNLVLWFPFFEANYEGASVYQYVGTAAGGAAVEVDGTRGNAHDGDAATDYVTLPADFDPPEAYTYTCWVKKDASGTNGYILAGAATGREAFGISSTGNLFAWHGSSATGVSFAWPAYAEWHHAAVSYDPDTTTMTLYIDGEPVAENTSLAQRTIGDALAFGYNGGSGLIGRAQDLRVYNRVLSPNEIKEIYRASRT